MIRSAAMAARKIAFVALVASWSAEAAAQGLPPFRCGPDCLNPGRYVLCNDNFDNSATTAGGIALTGWLERACAGFVAPTPTFDVLGFVALFGSGEDLIGVFERLAPEQADYKHHLRWGDRNGAAHIKSALVGTDLTVPLEGGALQLGAWQQIVLIDFDERPRTREIIVTAIRAEG